MHQGPRSSLLLEILLLIVRFLGLPTDHRVRGSGGLGCRGIPLGHGRGQRRRGASIAKLSMLCPRETDNGHNSEWRINVWVFFWKGRRASPGPRAPRSGPWGAGTPLTLTPGHRSEERKPTAFVGSDPRALQYTPYGYLHLVSSGVSLVGGRGVKAGGGGRRPRPGPPSGRSAAAPPAARRPRGQAPGGWDGSPGGPQRSSFASNTFNPVRHPTHRPMIARTHPRHRPNMPLGM